MEKTASDLLIECLENEGVTRIFGLPGEENLELLESIRKSNKIELILVHHEQAAGFMAATCGRLTGEPGVCMSTLGPGATNLATSAAFSLLGGMPMIMLTGQKPIAYSKQGRFQILDIVSTMRPLTKTSQSIAYANQIPQLVRGAFRTAKTGKPGPILLELPEDIAGHKIDRRPYQISEDAPSVASSESIDKVANLIANAKAPLIVLGLGSSRDDNICASLKEFIEDHHLYFMTTQMGKGVVDERHDHALGCAALSSEDYIHDALDIADLVLNIGHDVIEKPPFFMKSESQTQVVHISETPAEIDDVYFPGHELIGCLAGNIGLLNKSLTAKTMQQSTDAAEQFQKLRNLIENEVYDIPEASQVPFNPAELVGAVRRHLKDDGMIALDNGMYKIWFARHFKSYHSNQLLLDNALATMGAGLPAAIAAKIIAPEKQVIAVCGDGGLSMALAEMETVNRLKLDLTVVVVCDDGLGMIKWKQRKDGFADYGLDFNNPDYKLLAESFGGKGHVIEKPEQLQLAFEQAAQEGGLHVIAVPVDYKSSNKDLEKKLDEKVWM